MFSNSDFIRIGSGDAQLFIRRKDIIRITADADDVVIWHEVEPEEILGTKLARSAVDLDTLLPILNDEEPTAPPPDDAPRIVGITRIVRGQTANSASPLWRCYTDDGEQVNIFKHPNPARDTFHIIAPHPALSDMFNTLKPEEELTLSLPLSFIVRKSGQWNELIAVMYSNAWHQLDDLLPENLSRTPLDILNSAMSNLDTLERIRSSAPLVDEDKDDAPPPIDYDNIPPGSLAPDAS